MNRQKIAITASAAVRRALRIGLVLPLLAAPSVAFGAQEASAVKVRVIDVHVKVSPQSGEPPLPAKFRIEIAGHESSCGDLQEEPRKKEAEAGEANFGGLPACKVTVKIFVTGYIPVTHAVDLADYKAPIAITLVKEQ
jgi:hypothetical protein